MEVGWKGIKNKEEEGRIRKREDGIENVTA